MHSFYAFSPKIEQAAEKAMAALQGRFAEIDRVAEYNTHKVMAAFQRHRVSDTMFAGTTGYGYDDVGRDTLEKIYQDVFSTESALVRVGFVNGTHALTCALFGAMIGGGTLVAATGAPYDTLCSVIGISGHHPGCLKDYGVNYRQVDLLEDGTPDYEGICAAVSDPDVRTVLIQRSRGYSLRPALSLEVIQKIAALVHSINAGIRVMVDNCYGEFVDTVEPTDVGADLIAGSLIKNPGGGLAVSGGYVAGKAALVEAAAGRLTAPGIGGECGSSLGQNRLLFQGLFFAPHTVAQAMKTAVFCAGLMEQLGFETYPHSNAPRADIIQAVKFGTPELMRRFCRGIQMGAPIDSFVTPEPWDMPGYDCQVIMAAGAFVQGASIELSADGPMRPPYAVYLQGGLTFESGKLGVMLGAEHLLA